MLPNLDDHLLVRENRNTAITPKNVAVRAFCIHENHDFVEPVMPGTAHERLGELLVEAFAQADDVGLVAVVVGIGNFKHLLDGPPFQAVIQPGESFLLLRVHDVLLVTLDAFHPNRET